MIKLSLDKSLTTLDGQPLREADRELKMFHVVANALVQAQGQNAIKCYDLGLRFYSGAPVELDDSDLTFVREVIDKSNYFPLIKGPLLKELDAARLMSQKNGV